MSSPPPERLTRSRAAMKSGAASKTTKIVTAAARAKNTGTARTTTTRTASKRKTRADEPEDDDDDELEGIVTKKITRGRPRKAAELEQENEGPKKPTSRATRGRANKGITEEEEDVTDVAPASRPRGRPKKTIGSTAETNTAGNTNPKARSTTTKKTVSFQEPDKENVEVEIETKEPVVKGIKGRAAKRGGAGSARGIKAGASANASQNKKPLSPRKVTQMPHPRGDPDSSEDELAAEKKISIKKPAKKPAKSPTKSSCEGKGARPPSSTNTLHHPEVASDEMVHSTDLDVAVLGSPAKRPPPSPFMESMKSPAKRAGPTALLGSIRKPNHLAIHGLDHQPSPSKNPLLQSAAKRPQSPIKGLHFPIPSSVHKSSPTKSLKSSILQSPAKRAVPGLSNLPASCSLKAQTKMIDSPEMKPMAAVTPSTGKRAYDKLMADETCAQDEDDDSFKEPITSLSFTGRLSSIMPQAFDPKSLEEEEAMSEDSAGEEKQVTENTASLPNNEIPQVEDGEESEDPGMDVYSEADHEMEEIPENIAGSQPEPMSLDKLTLMQDAADAAELAKAAQAEQAEQATNLAFQLRPKDRDDFHDFSVFEEDPTKSFVIYDEQSPSNSDRRETPAISALTERLDSWSAASPAKTNSHHDRAQLSLKTHDPYTTDPPNASHHGTVTNDFFEQEMIVRRESLVARGSKVAETVTAEAGESVLEDMLTTREEEALATEQTGQPEQVTVSQSFDESLSDISQEYPDENDVPIDPALKIPTHLAAPVTPLRPMNQTFNTTTKVPLKPADYSTPSPIKKHSFSASRAQPKRHSSGLAPNGTFIPYSPVKPQQTGWVGHSNPEEEKLLAPSTPASSNPDVFSIAGAPARTPCKDLNPGLLCGVVAFVDVHTSEGAEASGIFVELLTQMGAKCLKTWGWNPNSQGNNSSSDRIGITHVIYKDGSKRTLEKVRQSHGVVQCVGVSWVLDCERENEWLDEAPYYIDTSIVPRGGGRRRKSMEPKALANVNGTLMTSSNRRHSVSKDHVQSSPKTPRNRRDSSLWIHSPSDQGDEADDGIEWSKILLTPVPKTPAPEAVARYAAEIPETPSAGYGSLDDLTQQDLLMRTCPPKASHFLSGGDSILPRLRDEGVDMRLVAARRKSMQFAPRISSPLAKSSWN